MDKVIPAELKEDNQIKVGSIRVSAFRKVYDKVLNGLIKTIANIPNIKYVAAKVIDEANANEVPDLKANQTAGFTAMNNAKQQSPDLSIFDSPYTKKDTPQAAKIQPKVVTKDSVPTIKPIKTISSKTVVAPAQEAKKTASKISKPISLNIKPKTVQTKATPAPAITSEPKESDEEILRKSRDQFGDLIPFDMYKNYYYSFDATEIFRKNQNGEMIDEEEFNAERKLQAEAIRKITEAEETERQAEKDQLRQEIENRKLRVQEDRDTNASLRQEIANREDEIKRLNKENQKAGSRLTKLNAESRQAITKINEMKTIVDNINGNKNVQERLRQMSQTAKKQAKESNEDYAKKQAKESNEDDAKKRVDEIYKELEKEFQENNHKQAKKEPVKAHKSISEATTKSKGKKETAKIKVIPQTDTSSLLNELSDFDGKEHKTTKSKIETPIILESTNPEYPGTFTVSNGRVNPNWKNSYTDETDNFANAIHAINQSDLSPEEKAAKREELYNQFDQFVEMTSDTEKKHLRR